MKLKVFKNRVDWPISGLTIPSKEVPVEVNFLEDGLIGTAMLTKAGDFIVAELTLVEGVDMGHLQLLTPSIRVEISDVEVAPYRGNVITVGLCSNANIDDDIKSVIEQYNEEVEQMQEKDGTVHFTKRTVWGSAEYHEKNGLGMFRDTNNRSGEK